MNSRLPKCLFVVMVLYALIHFLSYYSRMPAIVASHFDARGEANGWQTKQAFFWVLAAVTGLAACLVFALPALIADLPQRFINLPNKAFWLAPERLAASHRFLSAWFAWHGCAVYGLIIVAFDYAVKSNLGPAERPDIGRLWYGLACFAVFSLFWVIKLAARFARVSGDPDIR